jgi:hypothetical protein
MNDIEDIFKNEPAEDTRRPFKKRVARKSKPDEN